LTKNYEQFESFKWIFSTFFGHISVFVETIPFPAARSGGEKKMRSVRIIVKLGEIVISNHVLKMHELEGKNIEINIYRKQDDFPAIFSLIFSQDESTFVTVDGPYIEKFRFSTIRDLYD
jgi:hypothetical protein